MEQRELGRTGHKSTVVTFGTAGIGRVEQHVADTAMERILEHGVNHIDIAPGYGEAMERLAPWMPKVRDRVFLGTKTTSRTKREAWDDVRSIFRRLGVESFDLFQLHAVTTMDDLDLVTAPGGALETLVEMREQGVTKWLGITGHGPEVPRVHLEALRRFDFDTIMFPWNAALHANPDYRRDADAHADPDSNSHRYGHPNSESGELHSGGGAGDDGMGSGRTGCGICTGFDVVDDKESSSGNILGRHSR